MHTVLVMYILQHSDMLVYTQLHVKIIYIYIYPYLYQSINANSYIHVNHDLKLLWTTYVFHISFQSTQMGTYRHQVLYMFLLHKMVHTQLHEECTENY